MKNQEEKIFLFNQAIEIVQNEHDNGELQKLIDSGLEVNRKDEFNYTLSERAVFGGINYDALFLLWKAGAKPETEYIEDFFNEFKHGKTPDVLYRKDAEVEIGKLQNINDYTENFSAKLLKISTTNFEITGEEEASEIEFSIFLESFVFNNDIVKPQLQFIIFCSKEMKERIYSDTGYTFPSDEISSSSIYIQNVHNPVDLKKLTIIPVNKYFQLEAELYFDFEYEGTSYPNETITLKTIISKQ